MIVTITFMVDELDSYGSTEETVKVIKDAIDNQLINLDVYHKGLTIEVEK